MLGEIAVWQALLEILGRILAFFYDLVPNYGVAIILLTLVVRVALLPLAIQQVRSMREMQELQPKIRALQQKFKGNRQKLNEELMKLYREHGVNPLGGCLPLVLQLPVFIALYSVLIGDPNKAGAGMIRAIAHLPRDSALADAIQGGTAGFLGMNLGCSPTQAGRGEVPVPGGGEVFCGGSFLAAIPFYLLVALMVFSTWYQQRQMQSATTGQQAPQMQLMLRIMPVFLGFISLQIPAGVLVYWVTTNAWQIGQQYVMLRSRSQPGVEGRPAPKPSGGRPKGSGGRNAGGRKKRPKR